jgi:hypothetical protein
VSAGEGESYDIDMCRRMQVLAPFYSGMAAKRTADAGRLRLSRGMISRANLNLSPLLQDVDELLYADGEILLDCATHSSTELMRPLSRKHSL